MDTQRSQIAETTVEAGKREWVTPTFEQIELKQALSSISHVGTDYAGGALIYS